MNTTTKRSTLVLLAAAVVGTAALVISTAQAGPPAICHPVEIGDQASLPWGSSAFDKKRGYSKSDVLDDTLTLLEASDSALVHMETLRRATLYLDRDTKRATTLIATLMARALDAEAAGEPNALAWFDAGYLAQCYAQVRIDTGISCGNANGVAGYGWIKKALQLRGDDPQMEFGAAMATVFAGIPEHDEHAARVKTLAKNDALAMKNLRYHAEKIWTHAHGRGRG
ncbi:MAG: hypothetical protein V3T84_16180 [Phycisphaerales bacterium]